MTKSTKLSLAVYGGDNRLAAYRSVHNQTAKSLDIVDKLDIE